MGEELDLHGLLREAHDAIEKAATADDLTSIWQQFFGKKGSFKLLLKDLGQIKDEQARKDTSIRIQNAQREANDAFEAKQSSLGNAKLQEQLRSEAETLGFDHPKLGHLHPITKTIREMNRLFVNLGFSVMDGPEIEQDEYCFQRLNVPLNHPARGMQDTIYVDGSNTLLRTQTSSIEARTLAGYKPPLKFVSPGRVYRNENVNKSNHFIFHHYQGVVVMEKVSLKDLFGLFTALFRHMYGPDVVIRYRNKYYPEVEPGVGPDMQCFACHGKGCALCKGVGWIEMAGAGIIHPEVLRMSGIDSTKWQGFAFGLGLDRWVMARYRISDIRTLLGGNLGYKYYENENSL